MSPPFASGRPVSYPTLRSTPGALGLRLAADIFNDRRVNFTISGQKQAFGQHPERDTWHDLQTRSLTIEDRFTIHAIHGDGTFQLLQKRCRDPHHKQRIYPSDRFAVEESLLSHELYFGPPQCETSQSVSPGTLFRNIVMVMHCDPGSAAEKSTATVTEHGPCLIVNLPDLQQSVALNFGDKPHELILQAGTVMLQPQAVTMTDLAPQD